MGHKSAIPASDEIWSLIKETQENLKELSASQKELSASQKDTDRQIKETSKEVKKAQKLFNTLWGRLVESLVEGDLVKHLQEHGIEVQRTSTNEKGLMSYIDEQGNKQEKTP